MLLQLSDWQLVTTSLTIASTTRRRRSRNSSSQKDASGLPVALSFVPLGKRVRPSKRRKGDIPTEEVLPIIAVTTPHGISVLGKSPPNKEGEQRFQESNKLQFSSRPGKQSAFLHESDCSTEEFLPRIPAFVDAKNDRVYALQGKNTILVSWITAAEGPDDTAASVAKLPFPKPAVSMNVMSKNWGFVYGTLSDNGVYVGSWSADGATLKLKTFECPFTVDGHHVCTVMTQAKLDTRRNNGGKRKATDWDDKFVLDQIFATKSGFLLFKYQLQLIDDSVVLQESETRLSHVPVVSKCDHSIDVNQILHAHNGESIVIVYQEVTTKEVINGKKLRTESREHKACHLSLTNGIPKIEPFEISDSTRQIGFLSYNLLAAGTIDSVLLYDVERGVLVRSIGVSGMMSDTKDWSMTTDSKKNSIALLSAQPNLVHVAMATVASKTHQSQGPTFQLADGLRASMVSNAHLIVPNGMSPTKSLLAFLAPTSERDVTSMCVTTESTAVQDALASLNACLDDILDPKDQTIKVHVLLDAYEAALVKVLPESWLHTTKNRSVTPTEGGNGVRKSTLSTRGETPSATPQEFVDGATNLMLATLQLPRMENKVVGIKIMIARLDARLILYRLIRSGKVSARRHFQLFSDDDGANDILFSILRATKLSNKRGRRIISPVDLMHEMLSNCPDLTERQLVTMIHYMLCKALPHDIAENCLGWKLFEVGHPYTKLSKEYFLAKSAEWKLQVQNPQDGDEKMKKIQETIDQVSAKLLMVGLTFLVERIVSYSRVNESLLRNALAKGLPSKNEAPMLARILVKLLCSASRLSRCELYTATTKWMFALCDACREALLAGPSDSTNHLAFIVERLEKNIDNVNQVMSLGATLESMRGLRYEKDAASPGPTKDVEPLVKNVLPTKLAGYCIEELIL